MLGRHSAIAILNPSASVMLNEVKHLGFRLRTGSVKDLALRLRINSVKNLIRNRDMNDEKKKVLVVDDSALMRSTITKILRKSPHLEICGQAGDGKEALDMLPQAKPDLIITDVEMPVMDGLAFLKLARLRTKAPILVLSSISTSGSETSREAKRLGASAVAAKPSGSVSVDLEEKMGNFLSLVHSLLKIY